VRHRWRATRRTTAIDTGLAAWLDASARSARAGGSLRHALLDGWGSVAGTPVGEHLRPFVEAVRAGEPLGRAVDLLDPNSTSARRLVGRALRLTATTGGPAAPMLDAVAATLHERTELAREVRALATQARASVVVMVTAPVVFAAGASVADPRVGEFLASGPGLLCLLVGAGLDLAGAAWMSRLVRVAP
jgi:tight adherence protein B